ncbi:MAG: HEPN domain-containing protein [Bacteroidetes bacterium]|nr:HEPN domain-containing protein [Bacteroidota bacterium]MCL5027143.1 HEPN domain-containing protein [Chloroflexota bacterium]
MAKAQRFLTAAEAAFQREDWETSVSRSYYAVYHLVVALLTTRGQVRRPRWDHDTLINDFRNQFGRRGFLFTSKDADTVAAMFEERLKVDYEQEAWTSRTVARRLNAAKDLFDRLLTAIGEREGAQD